jgi:hypothetical protein
VRPLCLRLDGDVVGKLPGVEVAGVGGVQDEAEAFEGRYDGAETDEPEEGGEDPVPARGVGEGEDGGDGEADGDAFDAEAADEEHAGFVAVADGPADEIGVGLAAQGGFGDLEGGLEGGGVGGMLEGVDDLGAVFVREIQFSWGGVGDVVA